LQVARPDSGLHQRLASWEDVRRIALIHGKAIGLVQISTHFGSDGAGHVAAASLGPSVFGRNLPCEPVRKWTPERNVIGHTPARLKRAGVGTKGILECNVLSKTRTVQGPVITIAHKGRRRAIVRPLAPGRIRVHAAIYTTLGTVGDRRADTIVLVAFSVWTRFTASTGKKGHVREGLC
jgi:hypothetical protein